MARDRRRRDDWTPRRGLTVPGMFALFVVGLLLTAVVIAAWFEATGRRPTVRRGIVDQTGRLFDG